MSLAALPIFVRLQGRPVILIGTGEAADAKRRLLERAGARIVGADEPAALAVVALDLPEPAVAALKARGILVNAVDRPDLCDFTLPAIVDRDPVLVAIGTGGVSAGLAAALRQRLEALLPASLGALAHALHAARPELRRRWIDAGERRRAIGAALAGPLDPMREVGPEAVAAWLAQGKAPMGGFQRLALGSADPDDLTLREARALAQADRLYHRADVPGAILNRARADAERVLCDTSPEAPPPGLSVFVEMIR